MNFHDSKEERDNGIESIEKWINKQPRKIFYMPYIFIAR